MNVQGILKEIGDCDIDKSRIAIDPQAVETNIVFFELTSNSLTPQQLARRLKERGVLIGAGASRRIRLVTHYGVEGEHIEQTVQTFAAVMRDAV